MKHIKQFYMAAVCAAALLAMNSSRAADANTYQVTGPVLEVTATTITVQKGDEKWQIARDKSTKLTGDLKVGTKVTIHYRMIATEVEAKPEATPEKKK